MILLHVEVENFKRIQLVEFNPSAGVTLLAGENEAGKSSVLDAIETALRGKAYLQPEPVRQGQSKALTKLDLGENNIVQWHVERTTTNNGGVIASSLVVKDANGVPQKTPQDLLEKLFSSVAFDPLEFARAEPTAQDKLLKDLIGLNFTVQDAERKTLYDERTAKNHEAKQAKAKALGMPRHPGVPIVEIAVVDVATKLNAAKELVHARRSAEERLRRQQDDVNKALARAEELRIQLKQAEDQLAAECELRDVQKAALDALELPLEMTELEATLATAEETNAKVRANAARKAEEKRAEAIARESEELTAKIDAIDAEKQQFIAAAKFPVEGLGFSDIGPTLKGVPLEQASMSQKFDLSLEIGIAQNPQLKLMLIRDGSLLGDARLAHFAKRAKETGTQLIIERVGTKDGGAAIIIEDGAIRAVSAA